MTMIVFYVIRVRCFRQIAKGTYCMWLHIETVEIDGLNNYAYEMFRRV